MRSYLSLSERKQRPTSFAPTFPKFSPSCCVYLLKGKRSASEKPLVFLSGKIALAKCQTAPGLKFKAGKEAKRSRNEGNEKEVAD